MFNFEITLNSLYNYNLLQYVSVYQHFYRKPIMEKHKQICTILIINMKIQVTQMIQISYNLPRGRN